MELLKFMELLQKAASFTVNEKESGILDPVSRHGLECHLYLTADGHVSQEQTGLAVSFRILPKA